MLVIMILIVIFLRPVIPPMIITPVASSPAPAALRGRGARLQAMRVVGGPRGHPRPEGAGSLAPLEPSYGPFPRFCAPEGGMRGFHRQAAREGEFEGEGEQDQEDEGSCTGLAAGARVA
jgi:hypothetical protein